MTDTTNRLARAAARINATDLGDGGWAYYATETSSWWVVYADELECLCDYLDSDDPAVSGDAYSLWCGQYGGEEQPSWWTPDQRERPREAALDELSGLLWQWDAQVRDGRVVLSVALDSDDEGAADRELREIRALLPAWAEADWTGSGDTGADGSTTHDLAVTLGEGWEVAS